MHVKITTDIIVKTLTTGSRKTASLLFALPHKIALNFSTRTKMTKSPEQLEAETKAFILKTFCFVLVMVATLFAYSIVFVEQPLFNEAPADKAIIAILSMVMAQIFTVVSLVLTGKSSVPPPPPMMPMNSCLGQPMQRLGYNSMGTPMGFNGPNLDNSTAGFSIDPTQAWTPPPPPTTPPTLEHEEERERMAQARAEAHVA